MTPELETKLELDNVNKEKAFLKQANTLNDLFYFIKHCREGFEFNNYVNSLLLQDIDFLNKIDFNQLPLIQQKVDNNSFKKQADEYYNSLFNKGDLLKESEISKKSFFFNKERFSGLYGVLSLIKSIQPTHFFPNHFHDLDYLQLFYSIFGEEKYQLYTKYNIALHSVVLYHKNFISKILEHFSFEQKYLFAQYLYVLGFNISHVFVGKDYLLLQAKLTEDFCNGLNNVQKFNILFFLTHFSNHSAIESLFEKKTDFTMIEKLVVNYLLAYKDKSLNLVELNYFNHGYIQYLSFENNLLIKHNLSLNYLLGYEGHVSELQHKNHYQIIIEMINKLVLFKHNMINDSLKLISKENYWQEKGNLKQIKKEDLIYDFHLSVNEFFWLFKNELDLYLNFLNEKEKEFLIDSVEFLSKSFGSFSNNYFNQKQLKKQKAKLKNINNAFHKDEQSMNLIEKLFSVLHYLIKEKVLFSKESNSFKILELLLEKNNKIAIKETKKTPNKPSNVSERQLLNLTQAILSIEKLERENNLPSLFSLIQHCLNNLKNKDNEIENIDLLKEVLEEKIFIELNNLSFKYYYAENHKDKLNQKGSDFKFTFNQKPHYLLNDLEKVWENVVRNAIAEEKNTTGMLNDFLIKLGKQNFIKPFLQSNAKLEKDLQHLKIKCPNFTKVIDYFISQLRLNKQTDNLKPVLLCGSSGVGKTYFVENLAKIFNSKAEFISCPIINDEYTLSGIHRSYKSAKSGLIFQTITENNNANPIIVLDKIDQVSNTKDKIAFLLNAILEKESNKNYQDNYEGFKINANKAIYIATASDLNEIPNALLNNFEIIKIEKPTKEHIVNIIQNIWQKQKNKNKNLINLSNDIIEELTKYNLSEISTYLNKIANYLVLNGNTINFEVVYNLIKEQKEINLEIGASNFFILNPLDISHSLEDIKGCEEAKKQVVELVNLFTNKTTSQIGLKKPKGLVLYGPPGVGKTMLAKSFAKSVNMPFISVSGSSFVEQYVGVGAKRVRQLFEKARQYSPCIIYVDEMDALGKRGNDNNSERDATINEFLVQLDGSKNNDGIFVIGSTNYLENLDQALIRAGRFDRKISIKLPYLEERKAILDYISKDFNVHESVDFKDVAKMTNGQSPADLVNLLNQAAIISLRNQRDHILLEDFNEAYDEIEMGIKNPKENEENRKITAYHEAGHAVLGYLLKHCNPVRKVTVVPRANALGVTISYPEDDDTNHTKESMLDRICMTLGGRSAEKLFVGKISTGASGDIRQVTHIAKNMVTKYGFAEDEYLSMLLFDDATQLSDKTKNKIEEEMLRIVKEQLVRSEQLLEQHKDFVEKITQKLMEKEVIYEEDIEEIAQSLNLHKGFIQ